MGKSESKKIFQYMKEQQRISNKRRKKQKDQEEFESLDDWYINYAKINPSIEDDETKKVDKISNVSVKKESVFIILFK